MSPGSRKKLSLDNGFGRVYDVSLELEVQRFHFSGHTSLEGLTQMVQYSTPQKIYAIHGEPIAQNRYADEIKRIGFDTNILTTHDIISY